LCLKITGVGASVMDRMSKGELRIGLFSFFLCDEFQFFI
jgi:hypothetical protein